MPKAYREPAAREYCGGIGRGTWWQWRKDGKIPAGTLLSAGVRVWFQDELDEFLARERTKQEA